MARSPVRGFRRYVADSPVAGVPAEAVLAVALAVSLGTSVIAVESWLAVDSIALEYALLEHSPLLGALAGGELLASSHGLAFVGLLGLAASGDVSSDVEQLIEGVRDLASGNGDAEFALDRDDELGELSEELDDLATRVEERDRRREEYQAYTEAMLDAVDDVFYVLDKDGKHRRWNQTLCEVTGYSDDEVAEMHPLDFFEGSDRDRMAESIEEAFESEHTRVEADLCRKDGAAIPYEFVASRLEAPDGTPVVAGIGRDVTERREQEREREESERYRRKLYEATTDPALDDDETLDRLLKLGRERLGADNCHIAAVDLENRTHEILHSSGSDVVGVGTVTDLDETLCSEIVESEGMLSFEAALEDERWADHPAHERWGIERYLGSELYVDGELFGTLCFVDETPREEPFSAAEKTFVDLIGRWVSQVYEQREEDREREESERYRQELYEITSDATLDSEAKVRRLLELGRERLDVECGLVTRIDEETGHYEIQWAEGTDFVEEGVVTDVSKTYCREVITSEDILGLSDTSGYRLENPGAGHDAWGIECYIGGRIEFGGEIYGTLCFVDPEPRPEPFSAMERTFVDLMSRWIGHEFERQAHTRELRSKERAMEAAPVGITVADATQPDNPLVYANEEFESLTGYGPEEYLGGNCRFLQGEDTDQESVDRMREAIDAEEQVSVELRNYRADGSEFWNRVNIAPVENEHSEITEFVGFQQDVTERREAQERIEALSESVRRLESAETESQIAETVCSIVDEVFEESLCMLWQYDAEEDALVPLGGTDEAEALAESLNDGDPVVLPASNAEMEIVREGETRIVEDYSSLDRASYPDAPLGTVLKVPMEGDGLLAVGYPDVREVDSTTRELVEVLAKHAQASLDRVERAKDLARYKEFTDDVMNSIEDLFYVLDSDGQFERWNESVLEVTGYSDAEIADLDALDLVVEEDRPVIAAAVGATFEEGSARAEASIVTKDGDEIPYEFQAAALEDPDGNRVLVGVGRDISDRRERERQLEALVENTTDPIYIKDRDGAYQFVNRAFASYFETTPVEVYGKTDDELFQDETVEEITAHDQIVLEEAETVTEEVVRPIDGEVHVFLDNKYPYRDDAGDVVGVMGISRDITERKEREEELSRLISSIPGMVYRTRNEPDWPTEFVSEGVHEIVGYEPDELESGDVSWGEDVMVNGEEVWYEVQSAVERREPFRLTYQIETADGDRRWIKEQGRGVYDEEGSLQFLEGVIIDVTERVEYERMLEARSVAMEESIDGISILDADETYSFVNQAHAEIYGYDDPDAFLGDTWRLCYTDDEIQRIEDEVFPTLRETGSWRGEAEGQRADGSTFPQELSLTRLEDGRLICVVRDVTERKERERELERTTDLLGRVESMADIGGYSVDLSGQPPYAAEWTENLYEIFELPSETEPPSSEEILEFYYPADREQYSATVEAALESGTDWDEEFRIVTAEGRVRWVRDIGHVVTEDGAVVEIRGSIQDITEPMEYQRELERNRALLQQAQRVADIGGWELDLREEPPEMTWTEELYDIHGVDRDVEIDLDKAMELYHPDDREQLRETVEIAIEEAEPYDMEARVLDENGGDRWIRAIAEPVVEDDEVVALRGSIQDITDIKRREAELERARDMLQQAEHMGGVGGWELDVSEAPYEGIATEAYFDIFEIEPVDSMQLETVFDYVHPDEVDWVQAEIRRGIESGEPFSLENRIVTGEGAVRWVRLVAEPVEDAELYRGAVLDVTEQKQRELIMEALHETARGLLQTQTPEEVAELAIDTAEDVLDISCTAVYLLDDDSGRLEPVAYSHDFEDVCGGPYPSSSSEADPLLWEAYVAESATGLSGSSTAETGIFDEPVEEGLYVPIGDHGVFVVASDQHRIEHGTRRIAETLVATMEAALHRLDSETDLREREAELAAQNRRLRRQIQINEIIRTVDQSLIGASSREEIETAVCERLTEGDDVAFAWIGSVDSAGDTVVPRAWAGQSHDYLDAISLGTGRPVADPAIQTATTGEPTVVESVVQAVKSEEWRKHALVSNFSSAVAVPITFDGYTYGVLSVYGTEPDQFGDLERAVFEELGESIANSINAVETRQALYADAFVELTVHLEDSEDFLARVARETGGTVDYVGLGTHSEDESRVFFEVSDADSDEVEAMLDATVSVEDYRLIASGDDGTSLFEATVAGEVLAAKLVRRGGVPRSMHATAEELEVTVDVPASLDVREFLQSLQENHPSAELVSRQDVQRDVETRQELVNSLFEDLTNRQLEVLRTAYFAGFFGWPRESTGEDIADLLDVSQPTVNRHVRHALQRLLEQLFEEEPATIAKAS